jgi:Ni,Fe-hydrogenase III large subunit
VPPSWALELDAGQVVQAVLRSPSEHNVALVSELAQGCELSDALVAIASLDLSPWEMDP